MSFTIDQVNAAANDTFQTLWVQLNKAANAISVQCVTANTHANGGLTTGNGFVEGIFGSRTLTANTLRGGTVETPGVLTISSNVELTGNTISLGNVVINSTSVLVGGILLEPSGATFESTTSGTSAQVIDYFDKFLYRAGEYVVSIKDNDANAYQLSKVLVLHNSGEAYSTEYAAVYSNTSQGLMSANANSTHIRLFFTPTSSNTAVSGVKNLLVV